VKPLTSTYPRIPVRQVNPRSRTLSKSWSAVRSGAARPMVFSSRLVRHAPILFFQVYLTGSIFAFAFGPVNYDIANPLTLYTYVGLGQVAILLGYQLGIAKSPRRYTGYITPRNLLQITILFTVILLPITLQYRNYGNLGLAEALADPNAAYTARLKSFEDEANAPWLSATRGLLSPLLALFVPMGIVYWGSIQLPWKVLWGCGIAGIVALAIFSGAAVGLFDLVLVVPWMLWLTTHHRASQEASEHHRSSSRNNSGSMMRRAVSVVIALTILAAGIKYFSHSRQARYQLSGNQYPMWTTGWSKTTYGIELPESVEYTVYSVCSYWSHGYEGLSECLELPFEWSKGCGHSRFWTRYVGSLYGDPDAIEESTYPMRLQGAAGYDAYTVWHTAYPWLASDLTFYGAVAFMGVMGYLLALAWADSVCKTNPFALGFLAQLMIFFYYIPANAGRLSFPEETLAFWGTLLLWLLTRESRSSAQLVLQRGVFHVCR
jgi:hypothetical protein